MHVRVIPHHSLWIEAVIEEVVRCQAKVVFVSSHNEAVLLRRQKQTWRGRIWVLGHLEPGEVMAEVGRGGVPEELFSAPSWQQVYYFLLEKVAYFYKTRYKCFLPIQEARDIVQAFTMLFFGQDNSKNIFHALNLGYGQRYKAYQEAFIFLDTCVRDAAMDLARNQHILQESVLASDVTKYSAVIAVSQPLNDREYAFIDACKKRFQSLRVLLYGSVPNSLCVHDAFFFVKRIVGNDSEVQSEATQYTALCEGYACERYADEIDCVVALTKERVQSGPVVITSRRLTFLRSIMCRMRAEGMEYWSGLGDFFWDTVDGRWVLRCAYFLSGRMTAIALHTVLEHILPERILHAFDKGCLRQGVFSQNNSERFVDKNYPEFLETLQDIFALWARFQKTKNSAKRVEILNVLVQKRAFCLEEAEDIWSDFCSSKHLTFLSETRGFPVILKSMILQSIMHKRSRESILFMHPNDVRTVGANTVIFAGFFDAAKSPIVDEGSLPTEALGLRARLTRSTEVLDFLGCLSQKNVICTWHKAGQGGQVCAVSHLWFYAQKHAKCRTHVYTAVPRVYEVREAQESRVVASGSCMPSTLSATQVAQLLHNPYDFYMRVVLGLEVLPSLGDETVGRQEGNFVHAVLAKKHKTLRAALRSAHALYPQFFTERDDARLTRLLRVISDLHTASLSASSQVFTEHKGCMDLDMSHKHTLVMRADRIDVFEKTVRIGDFKTGSKDALKALFVEVPVGWQMAVEGLIAHYGVIEGVAQTKACQLCIWHARGRGAQTFSMMMDVVKAKELKDLLRKHLNVYYGAKEVTFSLPDGVKSFYT